MRRQHTRALVIAAVMAMTATMGAAPRQDNRWGASYFPNVTLTTQNGKTVRFYDDLVKGKIVAIDLIYTTCKFACPLETARLKQVQTLLGDRVGKDVFFYSITIDPEHDTPPVLKAYADAVGAGPGWLFLTGSAEDIDLISHKTGLYSPPNPSSADGHTPHLLVGNEATGQWIRNSAVDNAQFIATTIGTWLNSWHTATAPTRSYADAPTIKLASGEYTFTRFCAPCHSIGGGDRIGPDLRGVTMRRDLNWLKRFVLEPDRVREANDPVAVALHAKFGSPMMPRLGLSPADVADVLGYIERQSSAAPAAAAQSAPASGPAAAPSADRSAQLDAIVDAYLAVQRALVRDSVAGVAARARTIGTLAAKTGPSAASIATAASTLEQAHGIDAVRDAFATLSTDLIIWARDRHVAFGGGVQMAYCPMLRKSWLQRGATIENPFYGQHMSDCGRFVVGVSGTSSTSSSSKEKR